MTDEGGTSPPATAGPATAFRVAVAAAVVLSLALGAFYSLAAAPWRIRDEQAHTGYAVALVHRDLPTVDTPIEVSTGMADLQFILDDLRRTFEPVGKDTRSTIWVANHPPGSYLPALPGAFVALESARGADVVRWLRYANVAWMGLAVGLTALLALELTGRVDAAAGAAALMALTPYVSVTASAAMTDGASLAAVVGVLWATAVALRRGFDRGSTALVAGAAVACGLTRLSALATAGAVVGLGLVISSIRHRRIPWVAALVVAVAVAATSGWFYARNIQLYGDPAASEHLLDKFDRTPDGSVLDRALDLETWDAMGRTLLVLPMDPPPNASDWPLPEQRLPALAAYGLLAASTVVVAGAFVAGSRRRRAEGREEGTVTGAGHPRSNGAGWVLLVLAVVVNWLMAAQHLSGGGFAHARYLFVAVPAAACTVAAAATHVGARLTRPGRRPWAVAVLLAVPLLGLAALQASTVGILLETFERTREGAEIRRLGSTWAYGTAGVVAVIAGLVVLASLATVAVAGGGGTRAPGPATIAPAHAGAGHASPRTRPASTALTDARS